MRSIEESWQAFAAIVFRKMKPLPVQREEMKKAFFAGAFALLVATEEIGEDHVTEEQGMAYLDAVRAEGLAFGKKMLADYAEQN